MSSAVSSSVYPALPLIHKNPELPDFAFGKALWEKFFGDVGVEPPLPDNLDYKKIGKSHLLVLVPATVRGEPLTLKTLRELVEKPLQIRSTKGHYNDDFGLYEDIPAPNSHWTLLTVKPLPESRGKSYQEQQKLVASYSKESEIPYEVPTILDATVCLFMEYFSTGSCSYNQDPWTFIRCQEAYDKDRKFCVGGFGKKDGLYIDYRGRDGNNADCMSGMVRL